LGVTVRAISGLTGLVFMALRSPNDRAASFHRLAVGV
jgi:hypothetical protein